MRIFQSIFFLVMLSSCRGLPESEVQAYSEPVSGRWVVVDWPEETGPSKEITIEIDWTQQRLSAYAGCNQMGASCQTTDGSGGIRIGPVFSTEMFCEGLMQGELLFQKMLERSDRMEQTKETLALFQGTTLLFRAKRQEE